MCRIVPSVILVAGWLACGGAPPGAAKAPPEETGRIVAFDCSDENHPGGGLRGHSGPGPEGSEWNWFGPIQCEARVVPACNGELTATLRIGLREMSSARARLVSNQPQAIRFQIPGSDWIDALPPEDKAGFRSPVLALVAVVDCGSYGERLSDAFVGFLAYGE